MRKEIILLFLFIIGCHMYYNIPMQQPLPTDAATDLEVGMKVSCLPCF
jgi:hypothetical protein